MLMAVEESASGLGKGRSAGSRGIQAPAFTGSARFGQPATTLAAWCAMGLPWTASAQVVADPNAGANRPAVVQTANGLQQVNITRPSTAGVSVNAYTQFDVPRAGVILNNSPSIVATQQAGYVNGNPNLLPGGSARIIVNQATGTLPSQLRGYLEVGGPRTEVIVANPNGILVDGAGFINTSRATLTTGMPVYGGSGSLDAYRVTGGQISVQGAGLNAASVDQVDLIARAVQANASLYANNLNVVAGANQVDRATLAATPVAGSGAAPALGIDVSQLGGMYANKILLASTEHGVGVSSRGVLAAQSGDLTLTAQGRLVLGGQTNAGGNLAISAQDGIDLSGTTYGAQSVSVSTSGTLANSGTLAARQALQVAAGSIASTGTLGAGVDADGTVGQPGDLTLSATGTLSAAGRNVAGGNASLQGASLSLAGSQTSAVGGLTLAADSGNLDLTGATTTAGAALDASAKGMLVNDRGRMVSEGATTIAAGSVSNQGGQIVAKEAARIRSAGAVNNAQGIVQAGAALTVDAGSVDNSAGRLVSLNADGLTVTAAGALTNEAGTTATGDEGGMIGGNGNVQLAAGMITNRGKVDAQGDARVQAGTLDNDRGSVSAGGDLTATVAGAASNRQGTLSAAMLSLTAASLDNGGGRIEGSQLGIDTTGDLANRAGTIAQYGQAATAIRAGGRLDNTGGTVTANGSDLSLAGQTIVNDAGKVAHAGTGTLTVASSGTLSTAGGVIQTNGDLVVQAATLANAAGALSAQRAATIAARGDLGNRQGTIYGGTGLAVTSHGQVDNASGSMQTGGDLTVKADGALGNAAGTLTANGEHGQMNVSAASIDNAGGRLANAGDGATTVTSASSIANARGILGGNGALAIDAQALDNTADGKVSAGNALTLAVSDRIDNRGGTLYGGQGLTLDQAGATLANDGGAVLGGQDVSVKVASVSNQGGAVRANQDIAVKGAVSGSGEMTAGRDLTLDVVGDYANDAANKLRADRDMRVAATGTVTNTATLGAAGSLTVHGANVVNAAGAKLNSAATLVEADDTITNAGRIEGDSVQTQSATFSNTGTVIGNQVKVQGTVVSNSGNAALIAAAQDLKVYASDSVSNVDGATLYSAGNLEIARDGTRDAGGMLVNQVNVLTNRSATIEADGDIGIAAHAVNNTRTSIVTEAGTPVETARQTLSAWTAGLSDTNWHSSITFPGWRWQGENAPVSAGMMYALATPVTVEVPKADVVKLDTAAKTLSFSKPLVEEYVNDEQPVCNDNDCTNPPPTLTRQIGTNPVQYYQALENTGTTYKITFWPDWDPATQIRPDQVRIRYDLGSDSHDYSEIARTVATTTATDRLVSASDPARIQAQGAIRINSDGGNIFNQSSIMAAGGDLVRRATGGTVLDTGTVLQQSVSTTETSTFYWHQKTGGNNDTQVVPYPTTPQTPTTVQALPAIASSNQAVQTTAQDVSVTTVNRVGQTVTGGGVSGGGGAGTAVGSASGQTSRPQTLGTAQGGIPSLTLPTNGLFTYRTAPDATYLIATDARFTQYKSFISSDYMLGELGLDPQKIQKRLGDGFYEAKLIRDQVTALTGRTFLAGYTDQLEEYKALMTNGAAYAKSFSLTPGIGLSEQQMAQLTTDMVWLVAQDVTLADGSRQSVLVPKLYLARANTVDLNAAGALVLGNTVAVNATGTVQNSGRIVGDVATQVLGHDIVNRGAIGRLGDGSTVVQAAQDVRNLGGRIAGKDVLVAAGRDVVNETQTITEVRALANGYSAGATGIGAVANISATGTTAVLAGRDINQRGGAIDAGDSALLAAGRDLNLGTVALGTTQDAVSRGGQSYSHDQTTTHAGSTVQAGKNVVAVAGRDATVTGSSLQAGNNASLVAGRDTTVTAAIDTHAHSEGSLGGKGAQYTQSSYDETARGSQVHAGNNATLAAGQAPLVAAVLQDKGLDLSPDAAASAGAGNLAVLGSSVSTGKDGNGGGTASLIAAGDVRVGTVSETHNSQRWSEQKKTGFLSKERTTRESSQQQAIAVGSTVSANAITGQAGRDLIVSGTNVVATKDVTLRAERDLAIDAAQSTASSSASQETRKSGMFSSGGMSITIGKQQTNQSQTVQTVNQSGSTVGSVTGNVNLSAGERYTQTGSAVAALQGDVDIHAKQVDINAALESSHAEQETHFRQSGLTIAVTNPVLAAAQTASQMASAQSQTDDPRMKALAAGAAGLAARNAADAVKAEPQSAGGVNISITVGGASSDSKQTQKSSTTVGSHINAGGNVRIRAEGAGKDSNLNVVGSDIQAGNNVLLKADNQVNLQAAANTADQQSSNKSASGGVGVGISLTSQGAAFGVTANAAGGRGSADGNDVTWSNSHVNAGNVLEIQSGDDTNLKGAVATGKQVIADVGGNLNIESLQDTSRYHSKDKSISGSATVGVGGFSGSANVSQQKIDSDYASVGEQSGIRAGSGGYQIDVAGNTDLKGGVIGGGTADKNRLSTDTLTESDIRNHAQYSASSIGIGGGYSTGGSGNKSGVGVTQSGEAATANSVPGTELPTTGGNGRGASFAPPTVMSASGSASSTTASGVSAGTITIRNDDKQKALTGKDGAETIASLNRDTANTTNTLAPIFNEKEIRAGFEIVGALQRESGIFLNNRAKEAEAAKKAADAAARDPNATPEQRAALQQQADDLAKWGQGGQYRQVMTALTAAAGGNVTGSTAQFMQAAALGYLQGLGAGQVKALADSLGEGTPEAEAARAALHAIVGCAGAAGASQACGAGAMGAAASSVIGSLLGPTDGMTAQQKQARENLVQSLVAGVAGMAGVNAATAMNAATSEVENNQLALPKPAGQKADLVGKYCSGSQPCSDKQVSDLMRVQGALNSAAGQNATVAALLLGAPAAAAAGVALAGLAPEVLSVVLANPTAAVNAGIITAETAAAVLTNSVAPGANIERAAGKVVGGAQIEVGGVGKLIGSTEGLTSAEQAFVREMLVGGRTIEVIPATNAGRTADFLINGTKYELKTMSNVANQTSDGLSKAISSTAMNARGQSADIIIDARNQAGMTNEIASRGIGRAFSADSSSGSKINSITVITQQGSVYVPRKP